MFVFGLYVQYIYIDLAYTPKYFCHLLPSVYTKYSSTLHLICKCNIGFI